MKRSSDQILTEWLVLKAQRGDSRAMELLVKEWHSRLLRYASRQIRDQEAAKDVVQETFMTVSRGIRRLHDPAAFSRWIYQILHRRGVDYLRSKVRNERNAISAETDNGRCHEEKLNASLDIRDALRGLEDNSYQVVHLYYLHGFSLKEIARITGIPEGTAKSRLHAARNHLRQLLGDRNHE